MAFRVPGGSADGPEGRLRGINRASICAAGRLGRGTLEAPRSARRDEGTARLRPRHATRYGHAGCRGLESRAPISECSLLRDDAGSSGVLPAWNPGLITDPIALMRVPQGAPAYRASLSSRSCFRVDDLGAGVVAVAPAEGAGTTTEHLQLTRVCDASDLGTGDAIRQVLNAHPLHQRSDIADPAAYREKMEQKVKDLTSTRTDLESIIAALGLQALAAAQNGELDEMLLQQLPSLFKMFPDGSLWHVGVDDVLLGRMALGRIELARQMVPDLDLDRFVERADALSGLSLTSGIDFAPYARLSLVTLSPATLGFCIPALPSHFVFLFGAGIDLRRPWPETLSSQYRPGVLQDLEEPDRSVLLQAEKPEDGEELLQWWIERMNAVYSHATDPTRFTDSDGYFDASAQAAWLITVERLLGDALSLLAEPQATDLDRVQIAFDLLDKAESLLGYGRNDSGKGFTALLRRSKAAPRLREALASMPEGLRTRISDEVDRLYDSAYEAVRSNTLKSRLTPKGMKVASNTADNLRSVDNETFVATLLRAVRNSSHGLIDILRTGDDRFYLAVHTGDVPAAIPVLAPYLAIGLIADIESVIDGTWRQKLLDG